jgi:cell division GTPase FtsZ
VIIAAVIHENLRDDVRVTVIATGFGAQRRRRARTFEAMPLGGRAGESDPAPGDLDVPSFLRGE